MTDPITPQADTPPVATQTPPSDPSPSPSTTPSSQPATDPVDPGKAWDALRAALPDDVKEVLSKNGHSDHSLAEVLASYQANLRFNGADKAHLMSVPKKSREEDPDGWKAFDEGLAKHLGRPDSADGFGEYTPPEGFERAVDDSTLKAFDEALIKRGGLLATPTARKEMLDIFHEMNRSATEAFEAQVRSDQDAKLKELKGEWGGNYEARLQSADKVLDQLLPNDQAGELRTLMAESGFKDDPSVIRLMDAMARKLGGDSLPQGRSTPGLHMDAAAAKARIAQIEADPVYLDGEPAVRAPLLAERKKLYAIAHGDG